MPILHPRAWYRRRKQKKKEEMELALKQRELRILTFIVTFASMMLGLSLVPIFPQPLPTIISFLIAFATFMNHGRTGMTTGSLLIGLGLLYALSRMNIISQFSAVPQFRMLMIVVLLLLFVAPPFLFHGYEDVIAVDLGIIAGTLLFFRQAYYFAIPLILIAAVLFKKKKLGLTFAYYVLISIPLQLMQYLEYVLTLSNPNWWEDPSADPFLYVPLTGILKDMQQSMTQIRFLEAGKIFTTIIQQVTFSPEPHLAQTTEAVLTRYLDSLLGIVLFLVIVIGIVSATALITRTLLTKSYATQSEMLLPAITAASATALFFLLLNSLQGPLAFKAEITTSQMMIGVMGSSIITVLASMVNYAPKKSAAIEMRSMVIMEKAKTLARGRLNVLESLLRKVKNNIPVDVSSIEGRTLIIKDKIDDILSKTSTGFYDSSELDKKLKELDNGISNEINNLMSELDSILTKYQIYANSEHTAWILKLKEIGLDFKTMVKTDFQKEMPLEMRIDLIEEVLDRDRLLANEFIQVVKQIYDIIRSLCDSNLPRKSSTITFAEQKLDEKAAPWIAIDALYTSLNNWEKTYGPDISKSVEYLRNSLTSIINLNAQSEELLPVLGDNLSKILDIAKMAEDIKKNIEKRTLNVMSVIIMRDVLESSLSLARDLLSILHEELKSKEESIESLLLNKDHLWEKNVALTEQMTYELNIISSTSNYELNQVMEHLPKSLSLLDDCIATIATYNEKKEFLLNYPTAEIAIKDLLKQKKHVFVQDLPFEPRFAEDYLRLFYRQRYDEFSFDEANMSITMKA